MHLNYFHSYLKKLDSQLGNLVIICKCLNKYQCGYSLQIFKFKNSTEETSKFVMLMLVLMNKTWHFFKTIIYVKPLQ